MDDENKKWRKSKDCIREAFQISNQDCVLPHARQAASPSWLGFKEMTLADHIHSLNTLADIENII